MAAKIRPRHAPASALRAPEPATAPVTREFRGELQVKADGFGFVDGVFVPAKLIATNHWQTGQHLHGTAASQFNQKKGRDGWVADRAEAVAS